MNRINQHLLQIGITTNILEWYEFVVYAYLATIIGHVFFKSQSNIMALIEAFFIFSASYLARPIGSLFFGYIGDKYNPGISLKYSLIIMTIPTFLIGMLPAYNQVGYISTISLVLLRILQGFATGGELPMSASYLYSSSTNKSSQIFFCSLPYFGSGIGVLLASFVVYLLYLFFQQDTIINWAWRIPFLLGLPLSLIILYFRKSLPNKSEARTLTPVVNKQYFPNFVKALVIVSFLEVNFYCLFIWMPSYLQYFLGISHNYAMLTNVLALICLMTIILFFSYIGQFTNYKVSYLISVILITLTAYPLLSLLKHTNLETVMLIQIIFAVFMGCVIGNTLFLVCNIFPEAIKHRGIALSVTLPPTFIGGTAPFICSYFIHTYHFINFPWIYITIFGLITILVTLFL